MLAITSDRGAASLRQRPVVLDDTLERFPSQVEPVEFGIAMFQRCDDAQALRVMVKPAMGFEAGVQCPLAGVAERRMAEVVSQRQRFRKVLVKTELPGQRAGDLRHLQRMREPGAVMIAFVEHEYLGFVLQAAEGGGMNDAVAVAPERAAGLARRLGKQPAAAAIGVAGID